nr:hypothetical protein [Dongia deserti]
MKRIERRDGGIAEPLPGRASHGDGLVTARQRDEIMPLNRLSGRVGGGRTVSKESFQIDKAPRPSQSGRERRCGIGSVERQQLCAALRRASLAFRGTQVDQHTASDGAGGGGIADDEPVARRRGDRLFENDLHQLGFTRCDGLIPQDHDARRHVRRAVMKSHRHPLANGLEFGLQHPQLRVDATGRCMQGWIEHDIAASDRFLGDARARQRQRTALADLPVLRRAVLHMQRAHARFQP